MDRVAPQVANSDELQPPHRREFIPVDTMVYAPAIPETNDMLQLAKGLSDIHPALNQFIDGQTKKYSDSEIEAGKTAAIKNALTYQEAVSRGLIDANQSPWFQMAYKEQQGRLQGEQIARQGYQEYLKSPARNSDDPSAFPTFMQNYVSSSLKGVTDRYTLNGITPTLLQFEERLGMEHTQYTAKRQEDTMLANTGSEISNALDNQYSDASHSGTAVDYNSAYSAIQNIKKDPRFVGMDGSKLNVIVAQAVINKAEETGDDKLLHVLDQPNLDGSAGPGGIPAIRKEIDAAQQRIFTLGKEKEAWSHEKDQWARQDQARSLVGPMTASIIANPNAPLDSAALQKLALANNKEAENIVTFQKTQQNASKEVIEDPVQVARALSAFHEDGSTKTVQDLVKLVNDNPRLLSTGTVKEEMNFLGARENTKILDDPGISNVKANMFSEVDPHTGESALFPDPDNRRQAGRMFDLTMVGWAQQNPGAIYMDKIKFAHEVAEQVTKVYGNPNGLAGDTSAPAPAPSAGNSAVPQVATKQPGAGDILYLKSHSNDAAAIASFKSHFPNFHSPDVDPIIGKK